MFFLDAGYLIALFQPRDELHLRSVRWSQALGDKLLVTEYVLWECVNSFSKPHNRRKAEAIVTLIQNDGSFEFIPATPTLLKQVWQLYCERSDKSWSWSLTDCASFVVMKERGIQQALAHDRNFEEAGFDALLRREPTVEIP